MLRMMQNLAVAASVLALSAMPAMATGLAPIGTTTVARPALLILAQAAGPTTAGGTQPYISAPDSPPPADAKPGDLIVPPPAKVQSTAEPSATDSTRKPDLAEPAAPVKRLIDPAQVKKPATAEAPPPAPKNVPSTAEAPAPAPAPKSVTDTATVAKPEVASPAVADTPAKPRDVTEAAPKNEAPSPSEAKPAEARPDTATDDSRDKKRRKSNTVATNKRVPTERRVRERPVYAEDGYVVAPRGYYIPSPIPPRGIGPSGQRVYADNRPVVVVRRAPVVCHTYVYPGLFFQHREVRCP